MVNEKLSIHNRWRLVVGLSLAFLIAIMAQDIIREVILFNTDVVVIEEQLQDNIKDDVRSLVEYVNNDVQYQLENLIPHARVHAKESVSELAFAIETIITLHDTESDVEVVTDIVSLTEQYGLIDDDHLYSLYTLDGIELYDGFTLTRTNLDKSTSLDYFSVPYIAELLEDVEAGEAFGEYYVEENNEIVEYIVYAIEIPEYNLMLTSFVNVQEFSEKQKLDMISELSEVYSGNSNSVYIISYEGVLLYHQTEEAIGLSVEDDTYPLWQSTLQLILDFTEQTENGFLNYSFYSNYENGVTKTKIAYIQTVDEWEIIIGASSDNDIYSSIIEDYRQDNSRAVFLVKTPAYILVIGLSISIIIFVRKNVDFAQELLEEEQQLYRKFADATSEIIIICNKQGKILFTNEKGKMIIYGKREISSDMYFDQIMVEEEGYYILYGVQEEHFVKYTIEPVEYNHETADLYLIVDVTEKVQTEKKLHALSMKDELTSLYNRRMMVKDYKDMIVPFIKNGGQVHLCMIDLDNFKPANDRYGHSYGDEVLKDIARIFLSHMDDNTRVYRVGGDEFAFYFKDMNEKAIRSLLQHIQSEIEAFPFDKEVNVSFSAGVTQVDLQDKRRRFSDFYEAADILLYESKKAGKGHVTF